MNEQYLGVNVSPLSYEEIIEDIDKRMVAGKQSTVIAVNPEKVVAANRNPQVKELINGSTYQIADGVGMLLASKLKGGNIKSRVTGIDMMARLLKFAEDEQHPVYFYGAKEQVIKEAVSRIQQDFPGIPVAGFTDGYEKDEAALVERIRESGAEILFVALGSPKQEMWIRRNLASLPDVKVFQGVGGSFDVFSGTVKRAPVLFRKFGVEWLYRLASSPSRIKRQLNLPVFLLKVLRSR